MRCANATKLHRKSGGSPPKLFANQSAKSNRNISFSAQVRFGEPGAPVQFLLSCVRAQTPPRINFEPEVLTQTLKLLEDQLRGELHVTVIQVCATDYTRVCRANGRVRIQEVGMVKRVKRISANREADGLVDVKRPL